MTCEPAYMSRLRRRARACERNRGIDARGRYGYTARHVRCDRCLHDYLPQHVHRAGWRWECGNCINQQGGGTPFKTYPPEQQRALYLHRYRDEPAMLRALSVSPHKEQTSSDGVVQ